MIQNSQLKNEISGTLGKFKFTKAEHFPDCSDYHFNKDYYFIMTNLLTQNPNSYLVDLKGYDPSDKELYEIHQFKDTCIKISRNSSETLLLIFNQDFEKRKQTLKILEEAFV
jgi:hypothetical protein